MRLMALAILVVLGACKREPTFDERYEAAEKQIRDTAKDIDTEISQTGTPTVAASQDPLS